MVGPPGSGELISKNAKSSGGLHREKLSQMISKKGLHRERFLVGGGDNNKSKRQIELHVSCLDSPVILRRRS